MSTGRSALLLAAFLALLALSPGCLAVSIGQVTYDGSSLRVQVTNSGSPGDGALQVNVFQFRDFRQVEVTRITLPVHMETGTGTYAIPLALDRGTFRLYLYVTTGSDRRAGVIRDITVEPHGPAPLLGAG
jgi:hypothetical protein